MDLHCRSVHSLRFFRALLKPIRIKVSEAEICHLKHNTNWTSPDIFPSSSCNCKFVRDCVFIWWPVCGWSLTNWVMFVVLKNSIHKFVVWICLWCTCDAGIFPNLSTTKNLMLFSVALQLVLLFKQSDGSNISNSPRNVAKSTFATQFKKQFKLVLRHYRSNIFELWPAS